MSCDASKAFRLLSAGRPRGSLLPKKTQIIAAVSLFVDIALQVFTALLG